MHDDNLYRFQASIGYYLCMFRHTFLMYIGYI